MRTVASLKAVRVRSRVSRRRGARRLQRLDAVTVATVLLLAGWSVPQWVSDVTGSVAEAAGTGTGGMFVPLQARLMDTRSGTGGYNTPFPAGSTPRSLQVTGQAGIPSSGVSSVLINVTALDTPDIGVVNVEPDGASAGTGMGFLVHDIDETVSNTGIVEVAANGKIQIRSQRAMNILVDVQGYFQTGNGSAAPGGFVPVAQQTIAQQAGVAPGSNVTNVAPAFGDVQVTGLANIPTTATAVFANITVVNNAAGAIDNYLKVYPAGGSVPGTSLNFTVGTTSIGTAIDLNAQGKLAVLVNNTPGSTAVDIFVDVFGYFDGEPSNAAYNTLQTRLYDSRTRTPLQPYEMRAITVGGVGSNGTMPTTTASLAGFAMNLTASSGAGGSGYMTMWGADDSEPAVSSIAYEPGLSSNLVVIKPGTNTSAAPNVVYVRNNGADPVDIVIDAEGWFLNSNVMAPAVGGAPQTSGNRSSNALLIRNLTDRVSAGVNPTNGNLLLTQKLLSIGGVGVDLNIGVRYNAINDTRPSLNVGLFEAQIFRTNQTFRYTDATGTAFDFTPIPNGTPGTYTVPNDINATLTRTVSGSPNVAISKGATYELVFHPSQVKNVYVSDGANVKLWRTYDVTGANFIQYGYGEAPASTPALTAANTTVGKLLTITDTQGRVINFGYSNTPNPTQPTTITDTSINRTITLAYAGPGGALSQVTDATGANTLYAYNPASGNGAGKVASVTNYGTSSRTNFNYGAGNKISSVVYGFNDTAASGTWGFAYATGQTTVTDPRSKTNTYTFNTAGRVTGNTDARGIAGSASFSTHGEVQSRAMPGMSTTSYEYAAATEGTYNLTKITSPQADTTEFGYNASGGIGATADYRPKFTKDSQGNYSTMTYNSWGQPLTVQVGKTDSGTSTPLGGTITYTYHGSGGATCGGKNGQLCTQVDGKGNTTTFTYNAAGNLTTENMPAPLGDHTYTYDAAGRTISEVDGRGDTRYTCYDKNDRVLQVSYSSADCSTASGVTYTYDTAGNMKTRVDGTGTTTWTWDSQQRPTVKDHTGTQNDSTATYDRTGNVLTVTDGTASPNTTTYTYDNANNLATLAEPGGSCPATPTFPNTTKCSAFTMTNLKGTRASVKFPSGVVNTMTYDGSDRLATLTTKNAAGTTTFVNQTYSYAVGTANTSILQKMTDAVTAGNTTTYGYDDLNRLTTATRSGASWAYTYDKNGNRTQQNATISGASTVTNYGYNAADQLCWSGTGTSSSCSAPSGATTYAYDGNGNQTTGGSTYTPFDQLAGTTTGASQTYSYQGTSNDTRITRGGTYFNNNLFNQVTGETSNGGTKYVREPNGTPIALQNGGNSYYYTSDYNQSVILLTDQSQAKVAGYAYDPYGKVTVTNNTSANIGNLNPLRYATGYQDPNTGLLKLGARYYSADQGRFTQVDPSNQEANRYAYTDNNPATYNDPTGLDDDDDIDFSESLGEIGAGAGLIVGGLLGASSGAVTWGSTTFPGWLVGSTAGAGAGGTLGTAVGSLIDFGLSFFE